MIRRIPILFALAASLVLSATPIAAPTVSAATPDLTLTGDARYDVDPDSQRIHVSIALAAANHLKDTKTREYFFDRAFLAVQPATTGFKLTSDTGSPTVRVAASKRDHTLLQLNFGKRLQAGQTRAFRLTFDILDPGGPPTRPVRIGASLVSFSAWAFASDSTPGGSVTVVFPAGYHVEAEGSKLGEPTTDADGRTIYASGRLAEPLAFFASFVADRPNAYMETVHLVEVDGRPVEIALRSWPDDPGWTERVGDVVGRGVPVLGELIGMPWTAERPLVVAEATSRSGAGFSGRYDPAAGRIEIAYYADSFVILHEAAHAWFDGSLLADRWATEGFASWYASQAATKLGLKVAGRALSPELAKSRIPLNAWHPAADATGAAEASGTAETTGAVDDYGYAASAELARLIGERAGSTVMSEVWNAARAGVGAYQPAGIHGVRGRPGSDVVAIEAGAPIPDWRGLLDLLEDRTGRRFDDLWRDWVVREGEAGLLELRAVARQRYGEVTTRASEWRLPATIREHLRAWQFEGATQLLDAADRALDDRDAVTSAARAAGLVAPDTLRSAFEGGSGFAIAAAEADAEVTTIDRYLDAAASRPSGSDLVQQVGLWEATPDADLQAAAAAFAGGDLRRSVEASGKARAAWDGATEVGRNRIISMAAICMALLVAAWLVVSSLRGWAIGRSSRRRISAL